VFTYGGRALNGLGSLTRYQTQLNSEYRKSKRRSEAVRDKLHSQKGKNPDPRIRSPNPCSVVKDVKMLKQPGGLLRSSNPLKSA